MTSNDTYLQVDGTVYKSRELMEERKLCYRGGASGALRYACGLLSPATVMSPR